MSNIVKLNGSLWGSVIVNTERDLDRIAHVLDDCGLNVERHEDGVFYILTIM
jgi:hypothetical protein